MFLVFASVVLVPVFIWLGFFLWVNNFKLKSFPLRKYKKAMIIFPHPDDEVLNCGGLIKELTNTKIDTTLVILTKGERGTQRGKFDINLTSVRSQEAKHSSEILGIKKLLHYDMGDGRLNKSRGEIELLVSRLIAKHVPDLLVTYDAAGLYGHADHIVTSEAVTKVFNESKGVLDLFYVSTPKNLLKLMKLPEYMAKDGKYKLRRTAPTHKLFIGKVLKTKVKASMAHRSQLRHKFLVKFPLPSLTWFLFSIFLFEYFYEVKK